MSIARSAYTTLVYALLPFARLRLAWRSRAEPGYAEHIGERYGRYESVSRDSEVIWIHAVSVGETRAAEPLVEALRARYPDRRILLTHMTPTGRRTGEALFGERVTRCYLPYDAPSAIRRFLDRFRPRVGLIMETEVWPNLIRVCSARGVPLYLINARLSEKSFRRYQRIASLARESFSGLTGIAAQSAADAQRLSALGARNVSVTGNIKFDAAVADAQLELQGAWRRLFGARSVLLAASTRDGEEALLIAARHALEVPNVLIVIVPRHPTRFDEVAALLAESGVKYARRSVTTELSADTQVLLGDSMGEMSAYYAACDVAFIGGTLLPFGGQNLIEACALGKPVLLGESTYNFAEAAERAIEAGAALRVHDAEALMRAATRLLRDAQARSEMGERARAFTRAHQGATARLLEFIDPEKHLSMN